MIELLKKLSDFNAPAGWEDSIRDYLVSCGKEMGDKVEVDRLGNVHVFIKGEKAPEAPVVITASMDEDGIMIKDVTDDGLVKFGMMSHTDVRTILGKSVLIGDNALRGVVGRKPFHLTTPEERKTIPGAGDLYLDIGSSNHGGTHVRVQKGDCGVFYGPLRPIGAHQVHGKALPRSILIWTMLELMAKKLPVDTWFVFTTAGTAQHRGAYGASAVRKPGVAICLDVCPGADSGEAYPLVGHGPVVAAKDKAVVFHSGLKKTCLESGVRLQRWSEIPAKGQGEMFRKQGAKVLGIYCPVKYLTAPCQMADLRDIKLLPELLLDLLGRLEEVE